VATVTRILNDLRPSTLASAYAFAAAAGSQDCTLGQPAVEIQVRTAPVVPLHSGVGATLKINTFGGADQRNNYNGTASAMGEGMAMSYEQKVSATRVPAVRTDKAKGGNARGIPPRGRPV
jgi:hypothetical protein